MSSSKNHHTTDQQCTIHCSFDLHAEAISRAITLRNVSDCEIAAYLNLICSNCGCITDMGRTPLHIAASVGRQTLAKWLIFKKGASVNAKDLESGYTPLHRSILYGQIHVAVPLIQLGGDLLTKDSEGLTPIDIAMKDRARQIHSKPSKNTELYVWGSNCNYTLGTPAQTARNHPEPLDYFRKRGSSLKKVYMEKYHTVFLSMEGEVFSCGHGRGGRLGTGTESAVMTPEPIVFDFHRLTPSSNKENAWKRNICQDIAVGRDHTVFLMEDGLVYSCGLNIHRQLGIVPPQESVLTPHPIHPKLFAADFLPLGVRAGRYHSIIWNAERIYFVGMNGGQLGTSRKNDKYYVEPQEDLYFEEKRHIRFKEVVTSTGATVVLSTTNILTVMNRFEHTKVFLGKYLEKDTNCVSTVEKERTCITSIAVTGGKLEPLDSSVEISNEDHPIVIAVLFDDGMLYLWQAQAEDLRRCVFNLSRSIQISSLAIYTRKLLLVTYDGEVFESAIRPFKRKPSPVPLDPRSEKVNIETIHVKRIPFIHRAVLAVCDPTENNYATIQKGPLIEAIGHIYVPKGRMTLDMAKLLDEADEMDPLHDVVFQVDNRRFPAHLYIIAGSSNELLELSMKYVGARGDASERQVPVVEIEDMSADLFYQLLVYMYSNTCCLLEEGPCPNWRPKPTRLGRSESNSHLDDFQLDKSIENLATEEETVDIIKETIEAANRFGLFTLVEKLQQYKIEDGNIVKVSNSKSQRVPVKWDRTSYSQFHDVRLKSTDGTIFPGHKCILIARLEYFSIMFLRGWREASSQEALALPVTGGVLEILLEFLYTDKVASLSTHGRNERTDLAWELLIVADEFLMPRLKALAEQAIKDLLTIQNVVQVLNMAVVYNAHKLKQSCFEFISFNMANLLELRSLEALSEDLLLSLAKCYQKTMKLVAYRILTPHSEAPTLAEIQSAAEVQPPPWSSPEEFENITIDSIENKKKSSSARKRTRIRRSSGGGTKNFNESNCSVEFNDSFDNSLTERFNKLLNESNEKNSEDVTLDLIEPQKAAAKDVFIGKENKRPMEDPPSLKAKTSVPPPNALFIQKSYSNDITQECCDYPELGQGDRVHGHHRQRTKSERSTAHRLTRPSQKERKRLLSLSENPTAKEEVKPANRTWEKYTQNIDEKEVSFRDIMEKEALEARKSRKVTPACAIPGSKKTFGSHSPHSWSHVISPGSSPSAFGQSFPRLGPGSSTERNLSLSEIIAEENKRKENFYRMRNKPLHLTQIEDKAIDDLMKFYNAHNSHFERITVKRVECTLMAQPKWISRPLLSYDNNTVSGKA